MTFEDALDKLEEAIVHLEREDLTLDKALQYFENGIGLIRYCDEQLKKADGKVKELLKDENGLLAEKLIGINPGAVLGEEAFDD